jgi:exosome complex RNA-binding protein Rrp42 (RNase PH superfamily)
MMCREIVGACSEIHIDVMCGNNAGHIVTKVVLAVTAVL